MRQRSSSRPPPNVSALGAGLRLLGMRAHSRVELQRKLSRRGHSTEEIDRAMARLEELGYVNDLAFAQGLVRHRAASRGPRALSVELSQRGVDRAQADAAIAGFEPEAQLAAATRLAERLYAKKSPATYRETLDVVGTKLLRRGFSTSIVRAACQSAFAGTSSDSED